MNTNQIDLMFAIIQGVLALFHRHQSGEDVSASLQELADKVTLLLDKEQAIADGKVIPPSNG